MKVMEYGQSRRAFIHSLLVCNHSFIVMDSTSYTSQNAPFNYPNCSEVSSHARSTLKSQSGKSYKATLFIYLINNYYSVFIFDN